MEYSFSQLSNIAKSLRERYPIGTRIKLISMGDDPRPIPPGTKGTVEGIDDIATVFCRFDNGRSLGLAYGEDQYRALTQRELLEEKCARNYDKYYEAVHRDIFADVDLDRFAEEIENANDNYTTEILKQLHDSTATSPTYYAGGSFSRNANTTLYAVWEYSPETYTVRYNANGGTGAPSSQTKTYGVNLTLSSTIPSRSGYNFLGWSTSSTATSATYSAGGSYTANAGATLYAVWEKANYEFSISNLTVSDSEEKSIGFSKIIQQNFKSMGEAPKGRKQIKFFAREVFGCM